MMNGSFIPPPAAGQSPVMPGDGFPSQQTSPDAMHIASPSMPHLNPRSCVTCRRRKVKCDKREPCGNCRKAHIECVFPAPGRAPRRPRKPPDSELMARLRKLEGVVQSLGQTVDDEPMASPVMSTIERPESSRSPSSFTSASERHKHHADWAVDHHRSSLDKNFGRLVMNEGKTRYINNSFWASLNNEVEDLKALLIDQSEEDEPLTPGSSSAYSPQQQGSHQGFLFQFSSYAVDLASLHPPANIIQEYWRVFEEQCDPLVKMIHKPTMRKQLDSLKPNPGGGGKAMEAWLFSMYFAAVTSMSDEECLAISGEARPDLIARYRFGVEQALARASVLVTEELVTVQAFILFLLCLRRHEDARVIWSLSGSLVRVAITIGLHRDGTNFGLSPYDTEIRRRTWWQICVLDVRTAEDHGCDPTIVASTFDTKFPLNVDDSDIWPGMTETPKERAGITELTFCMIRFHVAVTFRRLAYRPDKDEPDAVTLQDKERWIEECHHTLEERYLRHCNMTTPMHWVICTVARLIMAKMWLIIYHEFQREDGGVNLSQDIKDRLFITSLESIEYALLLETEVRAVKWGWLFRTYAQWHALAYLLNELCYRTTGPVVQRAWRIVDAVVVEWGSKIINPQKTSLWRPLRKLLTRARSARAQAMQNNANHDALLNVAKSRNVSSAMQGGQPADGLSDCASSGNSFLSNDPAAYSDTKTAFTNPFLQVNGASGADDTKDASFASKPSIAASPFFANQPVTGSDRWNFDVNETNFLNNFYNETMDTPPRPSSNVEMTAGAEAGFPAENGGMQPPGTSIAGQEAVQTQPMGGLGAGNDPMVGGSDDTLQWDAWNDMIKEFQGGGANAWQQRNTFGDTWL